MDKTTIKEIISYLRSALTESGVRVDFIALFGSAMAGNMNPDSDIDLMVISPDFRDKDLFERAMLAMKAELSTKRKFLVPMDILLKTPEEYENATMIPSVKMQV